MLVNPHLQKKYTQFTSPIKDFATLDNLIYTANEDGSISIKNANNAKMKPKHIKAHHNEITSLSLSSNEFFLASSSIDNTIKIWNLMDKYNPKPYTIKSHTGCVRSVSFSRDSSLLISASDDKTAKIFQVQGQKFVSSLKGHANWLTTAEFSKTDNTKAITAGTDRTVMLWDVNRRMAVHTQKGYCCKVNVAKYFDNDKSKLNRLCKWRQQRCDQNLRHEKQGAHSAL